ncbi:MAG: PPC domain-containing protein, partial [Pirellulaceae bacterium]
MSDWFRLALCWGIASWSALAWGQTPGPVLNSIFPAGGSPGTRLTIRVDGSQLEDLRALWCSDPRWQSGSVQDGRGEITIPADAEPGVYDVRVVGKFGISGPRAFLVTRGPDQVDTEPNDDREQAQFLGTEAAVNGRFDKPGDVDCFAFSARARERLHIELWSNRLDAPTHGVLEVFDASLRRLAVNRGDAGIDPGIDFVAPSDGRYIVRLFDQTYAGGNDYVYRLLVGTRPHVAYVMPTVAQVGQPLQATVVGLNLTRGDGRADADQVSEGRPPASRSVVGRGWESLRVDVTPTADGGALRLPRLAHEFGTQPFALRVPGVDLPCALGLTDVPVYDDGDENHLLEHAVALEVPAEVSGQLTEGDEHDWYALRGSQGEVWWLEAFGDRLGAPIDLDLVLTDE